MAKSTEKVADSYKFLYKAGEKSNEKLRDFLKKTLRESDANEIESELKKTVSFKKQRRVKIGGVKAPKKDAKKAGKCLTSREKRQLGLDRLPKKGGVTYEDILPLNKLWKEYIESIVDWDKLDLGAIDDNVRIRLCRADFHGANVRVTKAKNVSVLGLEGLVVIETRNTLQIITSRNELKIVPKLNTSFTFDVSGKHSFSLSGSNMMMKTSERAVKKWKNKTPMDI